VAKKIAPKIDLKKAAAAKKAAELAKKIAAEKKAKEVAAQREKAAKAKAAADAARAKAKAAADAARAKAKAAADLARAKAKAAAEEKKAREKVLAQQKKEQELAKKKADAEKALIAKQKAAEKEAERLAKEAEKQAEAERKAAEKEAARLAKEAEKQAELARKAAEKKAKALEKPVIVKLPPQDGITPTKDFDLKFLQAQREILLSERISLVGQASRLEDEANALIADAEMGDVQFDDEGGEGDTMVVERERDLTLSASARHIVEQIDLSLESIKVGEYGYSEHSGKPIPRERLKAIPWTTELVEERVGTFGRR
jgi:RNA polymerase-binding transcription factor DksA